jgi:phosphate starvation-inducible PhoH-like protein
MAQSRTKKQDKSQWVPQSDKIDFELSIRDFPFTEKQKTFISLALDKGTKVIFLDGPAGSSKTILSVYVALQMLQSKKNGEIYYIRSVVESADKSMGYLPGEASEKFGPFAQPLMDKLEELLPVPEIKRLVNEDRIKATPVNFMRGLSINASTVIIDESQNLSKKEIITILTRIGKYCKFIFCGDHQQSDIPGKESGFSKMIEVFDDEESRQNGIYCLRFEKEDIMRSEILRFIIDKLEKTSTVK